MAARTTFGARPIVTLGGQRLPLDLEATVQRVVVQSDANGPDACTIVFADPERDGLRRAGVDFLAELVVKAAPVGATTEEPLFEGLVYSLAFEFDERGATAVVGAMDHSYALYSGRHTTTYHDVTDADLAQQLAQEVGLQCEAEASPIVHPFVGQINETHYELLVRRARAIGFEVRVEGRTLHFSRPVEAAAGPQPGDHRSTDRLQLSPGSTLEQFTARITAAQQISEVEVRGWDPQNKEAVSATAPAASRVAALADGPAALADRAGGPRWVLTDLPLATAAECEAVAGAEAERLAGTCVHAEGVALGDPRLVAGAAISVGQTGGRFDGQYVVSEARHTFSASTGYRTSFTVSGGNDRSVLGLADPSGEASRRTIPGVVIGIVTNNGDPEGLGRVKIKMPWLSEDYESYWARVVQLGAGHDRGLVLLPEVNDEVLVAFEQGDPSRPFVLGGLFNGVDRPPYQAGVDGSNGEVVVRALRTRQGHEVVLRDESGHERIELRTAGGKVEVVLDHSGGHLTVTTANDVVVKAGGDALVEASGDVKVRSGRNSTFTAGGSMTIEASGELALKGAVIKLN